MWEFKVKSDEPLKLDALKQLLLEYIQDQWIADHYSADQIQELLMDRFKRQLEVDLAKLRIEVNSSK